MAASSGVVLYHNALPVAVYLARRTAQHAYPTDATVTRRAHDTAIAAMIGVTVKRYALPVAVYLAGRTTKHAYTVDTAVTGRAHDAAIAAMIGVLLYVYTNPVAVDEARWTGGLGGSDRKRQYAPYCQENTFHTRVLLG